MKSSAVLRATLFCVLAILSIPAHATYPTLTGGSGTFSESGTCSPGGSYSDSGDFTITFSNQTPENPYVDVTISATDGLFSGYGYFISTSQLQIYVSGTNSDGTYSVFVLDMTISGSSFTASYSGVDYEDSSMSVPICSFTGTGSGTLNTTIINPATATPNEILNNTATLNQVVSTFVTTLNTRIQNAFRGRAGFKRVADGVMYDTGKNAGDENPNITGAWGSWSHSTFENDFFRTAYDGDRDIFMGGVDFATTEDVIVGFSVAYENANIDTDFNNGQADSSGYTVAPYVGVVINDTWSFDISGGFSSLDTDQSRNGGAITSEVDTERLFASINSNGFTQIDRWFLTGRVGALHARSTDDQFTESNGIVVAGRTNKLSQFQLGGEAAYELGAWEPYIGGTYSYDMTATNQELSAGPQPSNHDSDFLLSTGVRFYSKEGLTMSLGYDKRFGRDDYDEETVTFNARWDF